MVVFHNWLWESCIVYLTVLLFPELNKEHLEPVSDCIFLMQFVTSHLVIITPYRNCPGLRPPVKFVKLKSKTKRFTMA